MTEIEVSAMGDGNDYALRLEGEDWGDGSRPTTTQSPKEPNE